MCSSPSLGHVLINAVLAICSKPLDRTVLGDYSGMIELLGNTSGFDVKRESRDTNSTERQT